MYYVLLLLLIQGFSLYYIQQTPTCKHLTATQRIKVYALSVSINYALFIIMKTLFVSMNMYPFLHMPTLLHFIMISPIAIIACTRWLQTKEAVIA